MLDMKTASVRDVQHHLSKVLTWVEKGERSRLPDVTTGCKDRACGGPRNAHRFASFRGARASDLGRNASWKELESNSG